MSVSIKNYFNKEKQQRVVSITNGKITKEIPYNQYIKITDISNNTFEQSKKAIENYLLENE
jgi:hypothetical protein